MFFRVSRIVWTLADLTWSPEEDVLPLAPVAANPKVLARTCAVTTALAFVTLERSAKESAKDIIFVCDRFSRPFVWTGRCALPLLAFLIFCMCWEVERASASD